jgi:tRNA A37 threonylcarbamoyladenosine dehydratase
MSGIIDEMLEANSIVPNFSYDEAFSRNLGWFTEREQRSLRAKRVAIAGMGGVGGGYVLTLARLGVGSFHIADLDCFELVNFNRQAGATLDTIGRPKVEVLAERAHQINPELRVTCFGDGVTEENLDAFLMGVDVVIDAIDFFEIGIRRKLMARKRSADRTVGAG